MGLSKAQNNTFDTKSHLIETKTKIRNNFTITYLLTSILVK